MLEGIRKPIYSMDEAIILIPEMQVEIGEEVFSYETKIKVVENSDELVVIEANPIQSRINEGVIVSTFSLESGEFIIPSMTVVDCSGTLISIKVILQAISFEQPVFKIVDVVIIPDKRDTENFCTETAKLDEEEIFIHGVITTVYEEKNLTSKAMMQ